MEANLKKDQEVLLLLQEKGFFDELTAKEQTFVLKYQTQKSFDQAHNVIASSKNLYPIPEVRPLVLPRIQRNYLRQITVSLASAAAASALTFLIFSKGTMVVQIVDNPNYAKTDTVYFKNIHVDTVLVFRDGETTYVNDKTKEIPHIILSEQIKSLEALPPISTIDLKNKGETMKNDKWIGLMDGVIY